MKIIAGNREFTVTKVHFYNGMNMEIFGERDELKALYNHLLSTRLSEQRTEEVYTNEKQWIGSVELSDDNLDLYIMNSLWYWFQISE